MSYLYFVLDACLLLVSVFLLLRRRRIKGQVGFSLFMNAGPWKTAVEGLKRSVIVLVVPPLLGRLGLALLDAVISVAGGHPATLLSDGRSQDFLATAQEFSWAGRLVWFGMFELAMLGPIAEEAFFRGYLYLAMRERWNVKAAMTLNALLFAAVHFTAYGFIEYFFTGLLLCYFFERTRSLSVPIIGHMVSNIPPLVAVIRQGAPFW